MCYVVQYVVFQQVFGVLEVFGQFFVDGLFDDVWVGKVDQCVWFGDLDIVQYGIGCCDVVCGWMCQYDDIGQVGFFQYFDCDGGVGYLYQ